MRLAASRRAWKRRQSVSVSYQIATHGQLYATLCHRHLALSAKLFPLVCLYLFVFRLQRIPCNLHGTRQTLSPPCCQKYGRDDQVTASVVGETGSARVHEPASGDWTQRLRRQPLPPPQTVFPKLDPSSTHRHRLSVDLRGSASGSGNNGQT